MYVRWLFRKEIRSEGDYRPTLSAYLVESIRVDGKPRQRSIAYLANGDQPGLRRMAERWRFWFRAKARLERVPGLDEREREKIVAAIARVVPEFPTAEEDAFLAAHPEIVARHMAEFRAARREGRCTHWQRLSLGMLDAPETPVNWPITKA